MRRRLIPLTILCLGTAATAGAHDLFLTLNSFFLAPSTTARVSVMNGTFSTSDGAVSRERLRDLSVVAAGGRRELDRSLWDSADAKLAVVHVPLTDAGTYVIGASLLPREITLEGSVFNGYLEEEGILPILERRRERGELDSAARERYAKHVKALLQVGTGHSDDYAVVLGYPAELVPVENPYSLRRGARLRVRALVEGQPVAGQVVIAGGRTASGARIAPRRSVTDSAGVAVVRLAPAGRWYVKFIHMEPVTSDSLDYESKWATLTFEVR
ncbi:hypothetical protein BH23GEM2_BH23GEM2_05880 [soil metagenome]